MVAKSLGIDWKLHCAYRPQGSGQVERMNRTIKETLIKLTLETGTRDWVRLLPLALYRARNTPGPHGLTPFEIIYGSSPPAISFFDSDISALMTSPTLQAHLQALQLVNKKSANPYPPHTVQTTLFPALIPSRLEIRYWYGDIRPRPLNPAKRDLNQINTGDWH